MFHLGFRNASKIPCAGILNLTKSLCWLIGKQQWRQEHVNWLELVLPTVKSERQRSYFLQTISCKKNKTISSSISLSLNDRQQETKWKNRLQVIWTTTVQLVEEVITTTVEKKWNRARLLWLKGGFESAVTNPTQMLEIQFTVEYSRSVTPPPPHTPSPEWDLGWFQNMWLCPRARAVIPRNFAVEWKHGGRESWRKHLISVLNVSLRLLVLQGIGRHRAGTDEDGPSCCAVLCWL